MSLRSCNSSSGLPSLADRRLIARLALIYNAHRGKINIPVCNLVDRSDSRTRGAKNNYKYISTKNTAFGQSFFPKTLTDWNKLNNETKESSTTVQFKNSLWASHRLLYRQPNNNLVSSYLTVTETYQPRQDKTRRD